MPCTYDCDCDSYVQWVCSSSVLPDISHFTSFSSKCRTLSFTTYSIFSSILSAPTCCDSLSVWFTPLWIVNYSHHTDSVGSARNDTNHCSHFTSDDTLGVCVHHYVVLQWDTLKASLVVCPVQRDGSAEGGHVSDDRRVGSGCKWK